MKQRESVSNTQEAFAVYYNVTRLKALAVYMAIVAYGIPVIVVVDAYRLHRVNAIFLWVFCLLIMSAFTALLVKILRLLSSPQPAIVINHEGILDNAAIAGASGWIPWSNIQQVYIFGNGFVRAVHITPQDRRELFAGKPVLTRLNMLTRQLQPGAAPIQIMCLLLTVSPDELLATMEMYAPQRNVNRIT